MATGRMQYVHAIIREPSGRYLLTRCNTDRPSIYETKLWNLTKLYHKEVMSTEATLRAGIAHSFGIENPNIVSAQEVVLYGNDAIVYNVHLDRVAKLVVPEELQVAAVSPVHMKKLMNKHRDMLSSMLIYMLEKRLVRT